MRKKTLAALLLLMPLLPVSAQFLNLKDNVPRNADGTPNMTAPAPRRADKTPDLSGIWNPDPPLLRDVSKNLKPGELQMRPEAEAIYNQRKTGALSALDPDANCLPQGVPKIDSTPAPFKIFVEPGVVVFLLEAFDQFRQVFTDGRALPKNPNPQWFGYSVGKWEGDTFVVESTGFNGRAWLDQVGHPSSESMHVTERFHRIDFGHMEVTATIDDPTNYTKPWSYTQPLTRLVDTDLLEDVCNENNTDLKHLPVIQTAR